MSNSIAVIETYNRAKHAETKNGIASSLVSEVEKWFLNKDIMNIELSYLAQNSLASKVWPSLGYCPFRVSSHKVLASA